MTLPHFDSYPGPHVFVEPPDVAGDLAGGDGTSGNPYHSIAAGMSAVDGGGTVHVDPGHYLECVHLDGLRGLNSLIHVVPSGEGEVVIDAALPEFLSPADEGQPGDRWIQLPHSAGGAQDETEYYWSHRFDAPGTALDAGRVFQGAFYDTPAHTRLVSYGEAQDFRSGNELWPPTGDHRCWRPDPAHAGMFIPENRPDRPHSRDWVYMGPGTWFDEDDRPVDGSDPGGRLVHIRLAPTHNDIGQDLDHVPTTTDPNLLKLALSLEQTHAVFLRNAFNVRFEYLTLRFGSPDTIRLNNCSSIVFDHVRIRSGSQAAQLVVDNSRPDDHNFGITFEHCAVDGGIPTWLFRSDRKDVYLLGPDGQASATAAQVRRNTLGSATSGVQFSSSARTSHVTIHHCEIENAHDSYVFGSQMSFHHNWLRNLNDDGIALSADAETRDAEIYCNVVTQCLTALSFAANRPVGQAYVFANLIDIREPTRGKRPDGLGVDDSLRQGHFFKDGVDEGTVELFHNTVVVLDPGARQDDLGPINAAGFSYYSGLDGSMSRDSLNNIFVAAYSQDAQERPIAMLPPSGFPCRTDGNQYFRIHDTDGVADGEGPADEFIVRPRVGGAVVDPQDFPTLPLYRAHYWPDEGDVPYEIDGVVGDPGFQSFDVATGEPDTSDDFRLAQDSPCKATAVALPTFLHAMFVDRTGWLPTDRGCFPPDDGRVRVGVNGRRVYPPEGFPVGATHGDPSPVVHGR